MRLTDEIYLIGSGKTGFSLTDPTDCHVYAIDGGDEIAIIDAGMGRAPEQMLEILRADGLDPARVKTLILTHAHLDHSGGLAALRELTGARVLVPDEAAPWVAMADEERISLTTARAAGMYPADYHWRACPVDDGLSEGMSAPIGRLRLQVLETPGHSRGHCAYLLETGGRRLLLAGDLVFAGGRVVLQNIWDCSIQELAVSMEKLANLDIDSLLPGHGLLPLTDGQAHIDLALDALRRLKVPPNLL